MFTLRHTVTVFFFVVFVLINTSMHVASRAPNVKSLKQVATARTASLLANGRIGAFAMIASALQTRPAVAKTYFDTDVYGDKELKIATVNKLKQKLRNAILSDLAVAPVLLKLSINDALGYDVSSGAGGSDGSIQYELALPENDGLKKGIDVINTIKNDMKRTNTVSFSDVCAFAGAEVLETMGSGRIIVQVGRFDAAKANPPKAVVPWNQPTAEVVNAAFATSGLEPRDVALLLGALGEVQRVVDETLESQRNASEEEDEDFEKQPFVPVTFGARDAIYGSKAGKGDFGVKYLQSILKAKAADVDPIGGCLLSDPKTKAFVQKYASNEVAYAKDLPDAYLKLTLVGQEYTTRNS